MEVWMATTITSEIDIQDVWVRYKEDPNNVELRNILIERYMPLVRYNGERIRSRLPEGVELDDLTSAGIFGLMDAIDAFDMGRGVKFETYCVPRIRGAMLDELRTMDWVHVWFEAKPANWVKPPRPSKPATVDNRRTTSCPNTCRFQSKNWKR